MIINLSPLTSLATKFIYMAIYDRFIQHIRFWTNLPCAKLSWIQSPTAEDQRHSKPAWRLWETYGVITCKNVLHKCIWYRKNFPSEWLKTEFSFSPAGAPINQVMSRLSPWTTKSAPSRANSVKPFWHSKITCHTFEGKLIKTLLF